MHIIIQNNNTPGLLNVRERCFKDVDQMEIGRQCSLILPVMPRGNFILKVLQHISSCHDSLHKNLHSRKSKRKLVVLYLQRPLRWFLSITLRIPKIFFQVKQKLLPRMLTYPFARDLNLNTPGRRTLERLFVNSYPRCTFFFSMKHIKLLL